MNQTSKTILALFVLLGTRAYADKNLIERDALNEKHLDPAVLSQLLNDKILTESKLEKYYELNLKKVDEVLADSKEKELIDFLAWIKSLTQDESTVNQLPPDEMPMGSQDIRASN